MNSRWKLPLFVPLLVVVLFTTLPIATPVSSQTARAAVYARSLKLPANGANSRSASFTYVSCSSARNCTAVGEYSDKSGNDKVLIAIERAGRFSSTSELILPVNAKPRANAYIDGIDCFGTGNCTAVLNSISCPSPGNCVAVGAYTDNAGHTDAMVAIERAGRFARAVELPAPPNASSNPFAVLNSVSCIGWLDCVIVGRYVDLTGDSQAMVDPWIGAKIVPAVEFSPPPDSKPLLAGVSDSCDRQGDCTSLNAVSCTAQGSCTAAGEYTDRAGNSAAMMTNFRNRRFEPATKVIGSQPVLNSLSCSRSRNCAAVGTFNDNSGNNWALFDYSVGGPVAPAAWLRLPSHSIATQPSVLNAVDCPGACTAVGGYVDASGNTEAMVTSFSNSTVATTSKLVLPGDVVPIPEFNSGGTCDGSTGCTSLTNVSCATVGNCVAIGSFSDGSFNTLAMLAREVKGAFDPGVNVSLPSDAATSSQNAVLYSVSCWTSGDCTAVGSYVDGSGHNRVMIVKIRVG